MRGMSNVFEAVICDTDSAFERESLVETIKRRIGVGRAADSVTTLMTTAVSAATPFPRFVVLSAMLFDSWVIND